MRSEEEEKEGGSSLPFILRPSDFENQVGITVRAGVWSSVASNPRAIASVAQVFRMIFPFVPPHLPPSPTHTLHSITMASTM